MFIKLFLIYIYIYNFNIMISSKIKLNKKNKNNHFKIYKKNNILLQKPLINYIRVNNNNYKSTIVDICKIYTNINTFIVL
jgi:hypothetical protein